ncbi:MAG: hypothetical protein AVDCRST_MAG76-1012, partial [uncultured Acidimicrobiales bacterium]
WLPGKRSRTTSEPASGSTAKHSWSSVAHPSTRRVCCGTQMRRAAGTRGPESHSSRSRRRSPVPAGVWRRSSPGRVYVLAGPTPQCVQEWCSTPASSCWRPSPRRTTASCSPRTMWRPRSCSPRCSGRRRETSTSGGVIQH